MSREDEISAMTENIRLAEGEAFEADEAAIVSDFLKNNQEQSTLAIKILSVLGGLFATIAFLGFLFLSELLKSGIVISLTGLLFIAAAVWLSKQFDQLIIDTGSIAAFIAGFFLLSQGLYKLEANNNLISVILMIVALASLLVTRNYLLSLISMLIISGSILQLIINNDYDNFIHFYNSAFTLLLVYFTLNEARFITRLRKLAVLYDPIRAALTGSVLIGLCCIGKRHLIDLNPDYTWLSSITIIASIFYLVRIHLVQTGIEKSKDRIIVYGVASLILLPTLFAPAIAGALLIILLGFHVHFRTGLAIGILSFIYFVCQYYYDLDLTLLVKSGILFSSGILFLVCYLFIHKKTGNDEKI